MCITRRKNRVHDNIIEAANFIEQGNYQCMNRYVKIAPMLTYAEQKSFFRKLQDIKALQCKVYHELMEGSVKEVILED